MGFEPRAPRTLLEQLIRQRDTTYEELCEQYDKLARHVGEKATISVRHLQRLAYGERSSQHPTPGTRRVMRQLFGYSMDELLGPPATEAELRARNSSSTPVVPRAQGDASPAIELAEHIRVATRVDAALVRMLADQTNYLRIMDRRVGGIALTQQLAGHIASVQFLLDHAVLGQQRTPLAAELSDAEALAAWVALDLGDFDGAWHHHQVARLAAREAGSRPLLAHAMAQQAFVLIEVNETGHAVDLVREARSTAAGPVPQLLACWLSAAEGEVLAVAGDDRGSRLAFDHAIRLLPENCGDPELPYITLDERHLARWHGNVLARLGDTAAIDRLYQALAASDHSLRARAGLHADLAYALTASGDDDQAEAQLRQAAELADQAGSRRQRRRILQLTAQRQHVQQCD